METNNLIALGALALGVVNFAWMFVRHCLDHRVRLLWDVARGVSVDHPDGFVQITLINRGRTVLINSVTVSMWGPPLDEMTDEEFQRQAAEQEEEFKRLGYTGGRGRKVHGRLGRSESHELRRHDCHQVVIPRSFEKAKLWPDHRSGIEVVLRDGRSRRVTWAEIDRRRSRWDVLDIRRHLRWLERA